MEEPGDKQEDSALPSEPQPQGDSDGSGAVEDTSFLINELAAKLRKSLTLDEQPNLESFVAEVQLTAETDSRSDSADIAAETHPADDSSTFYDCENKSFHEKAIVEPAQDTADNILPTLAQSEVSEPDVVAVASKTDEREDSDSVVVEGKMADNVDQPRSPPIAITRGNYNINWDELDENSDPFTLKKGLPNSPLPKSPIVPACVGAGDGNTVANELDPFNPSLQLTSSPLAPAAVAGSADSPVKQNQRRSINNNLPEPVTDTVVSEPVDSVAQLDAMDDVPVVDENKTPSKNISNDTPPDVLEDKAATACPETVE